VHKLGRPSNRPICSEIAFLHPTVVCTAGITPLTKFGHDAEAARHQAAGQVVLELELPEAGVALHASWKLIQPPAPAPAEVAHDEVLEVRGVRRSAT
jgi:hypothetical protein